MAPARSGEQRPQVVIRSRGQGNPTFVPARRPNRERGDRAASKEQGASEARRTSTILCVEDSPTHLKLLIRLLELSLETRALAAHSVETALGLLLRERPDLIVTDLMMPDMDGADLIAILQSRPDWRDIPVVVHSVVSDLSRVRTLVDSGVRDYLLKPFNADVAVPRIKRILAAAPPIGERAPVARAPAAPERVPVVFVTSDSELLEKLRVVLDPVWDVVPARSGPEAVAIAVEVRPWGVCIPGDVAVWGVPKTMKSLLALKGFEKLRVIPLSRGDRDVGVVLEAVQRELRSPPFAVSGDAAELTVTVHETFTVECAGALRTLLDRAIGRGSARILIDVPYLALGSQAVSALHAVIQSISDGDD